MKVYLYIASSLNGCIARKDGSTNWSAEDNTSYLSFCRQIEAVVMGRNTYEEYLKLPDSDWPNPKGTTVVLSSKKILPVNNFQVHIANNGPKEAIEILQNLGKKELIVIGGNKTWTSFMKEGLGDEIILDVEPYIFGGGISLFSGSVFETNLELLERKFLSSQTVQLHYRIIK